MGSGVDNKSYRRGRYRNASKSWPEGYLTDQGIRLGQIGGGGVAPVGGVGTFASVLGADYREELDPAENVTKETQSMIQRITAWDGVNGAIALSKAYSTAPRYIDDDGGSPSVDFSTSDNYLFNLDVTAGFSWGTNLTVWSLVYIENLTTLKCLWWSQGGSSGLWPSGATTRRVGILDDTLYNHTTEVVVGWHVLRWNVNTSNDAAIAIDDTDEETFTLASWTDSDITDLSRPFNGQSMSGKLKHTVFASADIRDGSTHDAVLAVFKALYPNQVPY